MKLMKLAILGMSAFTTVALAQAPAAARPVPHEPVMSSELFVQKAALAGMFEVEAGKLALSRSSNADVRAFAQLMTKDHGAAGAELARLVKGTAFALPAQLDQEHQARLKELKGASTGKFDAAYGKDMVEAHDQAVTLFTKAAAETLVSADLRSFASRTLPALQAHHELAARLPAEK